MDTGVIVLRSRGELRRAAAEGHASLVVSDLKIVMGGWWWALERVWMGAFYERLQSWGARRFM